MCTVQTSYPAVLEGIGISQNSSKVLLVNLHQVHQVRINFYFAACGVPCMDEMTLDSMGPETVAALAKKGYAALMDHYELPVRSKNDEPAFVLPDPTPKKKAWSRLQHLVCISLTKNI